MFCWRLTSGVHPVSRRGVIWPSKGHAILRLADVIIPTTLNRFYPPVASLFFFWFATNTRRSLTFCGAIAPITPAFMFQGCLAQS